jgi:hypothetical protein
MLTVTLSGEEHVRDKLAAQAPACVALARPQMAKAEKSVKQADRPDSVRRHIPKDAAP